MLVALYTSSYTGRTPTVSLHRRLTLSCSRREEMKKLRVLLLQCCWNEFHGTNGKEENFSSLENCFLEDGTWHFDDHSWFLNYHFFYKSIAINFSNYTKRGFKTRMKTSQIKYWSKFKSIWKLNECVQNARIERELKENAFFRGEWSRHNWFEDNNAWNSWFTFDSRLIRDDRVLRLRWLMFLL